MLGSTLVATLALSLSCWSYRVEGAPPDPQALGTWTGTVSGAIGLHHGFHVGQDGAYRLHVSFVTFSRFTDGEIVLFSDDVHQAVISDPSGEEPCGE